MRTPDQYREFAAECYRLASEAKTEQHQRILQEMARAWREVAEEVEAKSKQPAHPRQGAADDGQLRKVAGSCSKQHLKRDRVREIKP